MKYCSVLHGRVSVMIKKFLCISGSKHEAHKFDELTEEQSTHRLVQLAMKMDRDDNGHVNKEELTDWIEKSYEYLHYSVILSLNKA